MLNETVVDTGPPVFQGTVANADFISGDALASAIGLTAGVSINSTTSPWFHWIAHGRDLFVPQYALRWQISWNAIYQVGAVHGTSGVGIPTNTTSPRSQNAMVTIADKVYRVRLLKGANTNPYQGFTTGHDIVSQQQSEWNALWYPIIDDPNALSFTGEKQAHYAIGAVWMTGTGGSASWVQEVNSTNASAALSRGADGPSYAQANTTPSIASSNYAWRPCLEST